ncbi:twin-arginine translocation signal domain-containing protein [Candidatus Woesearchaeota archaeon]|nr:twin-arginine translocation signal domain-containing protein [Candidatus Woesearchaeota archaeon]
MSIWDRIFSRREFLRLSALTAAAAALAGCCPTGEPESVKAPPSREEYVPPSDVVLDALYPDDMLPGTNTLVGMYRPPVTLAQVVDHFYEVQSIADGLSCLLDEAENIKLYQNISPEERIKLYSALGITISEEASQSNVPSLIDIDNAVVSILNNLMISSYRVRFLEDRLLYEPLDEATRSRIEKAAFHDYSSVLILEEALASFFKSVGKDYDSSAVFNWAYAEVYREDPDGNSWFDFYNSVFSNFIGSEKHIFMKAERPNNLSYKWIDCEWQNCDDNWYQGSALIPTTSDEIIGTAFVNLKDTSHGGIYENVPGVFYRSKIDTGDYYYGFSLLKRPLIADTEEGEWSVLLSCGDKIPLKSVDELSKMLYTFGVNEEAHSFEMELSDTTCSVDTGIYDDKFGKSPFTLGTNNPICISHPAARVITRDRSLADSPDEIAKLATQMVDQYDITRTTMDAFNFERSILYSNFYLTEYHPDKGDFERNWLPAKKSELIENHGYADLDSAYRVYLSEYGLTEEDLTIELFGLNILPRLVLEDLVYKQGGFNEDALRETIREPIEIMLKYLEETGLINAYLNDERFSETLKQKYQQLLNEGKITLPKDKSVDDLVIDAENNLRSFVNKLHDNDALNAFADQIIESLNWVGRIKEITLYKSKEDDVTLVQRADGTAEYTYRVPGEHAWYQKSYKLETRDVIIVDESGNPINFTKPYSHNTSAWHVIDKETGEKIKFSEEGEDACKFKVGKVKITETTIPSHSNLWSSCRDDVDCTNYQNIELNGNQDFIRIASFPKKEKDGSYERRLGAVQRSDDGTEYFSWWNGEMEDPGGEPIFRHTEMSSDRFNQLFGPELRLLPGLYSPDFTAIGDLLRLIATGQATRIRGGDRYASLPNPFIRKALYESMMTPSPRTHYWAVGLPADTEINNFKGQIDPVERKEVNLHILASNMDSPTSWHHISGGEWLYSNIGSIPLSTYIDNRDEAIPLLSKSYLFGNSVELIKDTEGNEYAVVGMVGRPDQNQGEGIWSYINEVFTHFLRGKDHSVALAIPKEELSIVNTKPFLTRLWNAGGLKDTLFLVGYLAAHAALGEILMAVAPIWPDAAILQKIISLSVKYDLSLDPFALSSLNGLEYINLIR